MLGRDAMFKV